MTYESSHRALERLIGSDFLARWAYLIATDSGPFAMSGFYEPVDVINLRPCPRVQNQVHLESLGRSPLSHGLAIISILRYVVRIFYERYS